MGQVTASLLCSPLLPSSTIYQNRVSSKSSSYRVSFNARKSGSQIVSSKNVGSEAGLNGPTQNSPSVFKISQMPLDIKTTYDAEKLRLDYIKCVPESCSQTVSSKSAGTEAGLNRPNQNRLSVYQYILMPLKSRRTDDVVCVDHVRISKVDSVLPRPRRPLANEEYCHVRPLPPSLGRHAALGRHVRPLPPALGRHAALGRHVRPLPPALGRHVRPLPMALANEEHRHVRPLPMAIIKTYKMEVVPLSPKIKFVK